MNQNRYIRRKAIQPIEEVRRAKWGNVKYHWWHVVSSFKEMIKEIFYIPREIEYEKYEVVHPGEPGYEEAEIVFDPSSYQGEMKWQNHQL